MLSPVHARAFAVHIFTATGAALALGALIYAVRGQWAAMFLCLGIAFIVDGVDGTMARAVKVAEVLPRWSGDVLDLVVDFVTYVFVPAYAIAAGGLLPDILAVPAGVLLDPHLSRAGRRHLDILIGEHLGAAILMYPHCCDHGCASPAA